MNVDYIIDAHTVWVARAVLNDDTQREIALRTFEYLGIPDIEAVELTPDGKAIKHHEDVNALRSRLSAALGDLSPRRASANAEFLRANPLYGEDDTAVIDALSADWLTTLGISTAETYLLSSFNLGVEIHRRNGHSIDAHAHLEALTRDLSPPVLEIQRMLGRGCTWMGGAILLKNHGEYPDIARARAEGGLLRDVISHPVLDWHDLRIASWEDPEEIVTDVAWVPIFSSAKA